MLLFYFSLGFFLFFLQHLVPFPAEFHLDLLTLFIVFVSLRTAFLVAAVLALFVGFILDCYGLPPLGLHAALLLTAVVATAVLRRHLNFLYVLPQITGVISVMLLQALVMVGLLHLLSPVPVVYPAMLRQACLQVVATALCSPIVFSLFNLLEKGWRHFSLKKSLRTFGER
ncbi:MAG: rod shape-determining protein MreD [Desulfobacca sp.]|uniref:rod shape-determining protein MreD n=1 Tax=Desulfobacca sp. TaxID=2067990 RepID=UPI004049BB06